ncbi:Indigoidine synthase A like protein-domain-containing protein [Rhexocercosporidium sp. MPI-PUGE-AT-0058]|nr:Indigoidine synthase A like protein-domain-containing protein [Rhexocercosporidium sp. MPI-PUGE-AT-0058]
MRTVPVSCGALAGVKGVRPGAVIRYSRSFSLSPDHHRKLHAIQGRIARATLGSTGFHISRRFESTVRYVPRDAPRPRSTEWNDPTNKRVQFQFPDSLCSKVSEEVKHALNTNHPVVALESTIYTHGFPYPQNVALALGLEEIVRRHGAVPATIGILKGVARIGLTKEEITLLASTAGKPETMKVSRRDLPYILGMGMSAKKLNGGTTVSGTMMLAHRAGIKVFGTGGLGGVHRGGEDSMDISADLTELGRTPIAVVSSGCKSFLDIPRTLEFLETQGATVCTFADGRKGDIDFPAFYTRDSGIKSHGVVHNPREAASMIYAQELLGNWRTGHSSMHSGLLFANPIPVEFSIPKAEIDIAINQAVKEAAEQGFHGHANTPFILARIKDLTKGNSLPANKALIESNVAMAARIAVELAALKDAKGKLPRLKADPQNRINASEKEQFYGGFANLPSDQRQIKPLEDSSVRPWSSGFQGAAASLQQVDPITNHSIYVLGSVAVDLSCDYTPLEEAGIPSVSGSPQLHTSNIAKIVPSIGGVGHNVALAAHRASGDSSVQLRSFVADDLAGNTIISALGEEGLDTSGIETLPSKVSNAQATSHRTAQYVAVNDIKKDLVLAMADMSIFANVSPNSLMKMSSSPNLKWTVVDANWNKTNIRSLLAYYHSMNAKVAFEPVSVAKSAGIFELDNVGTNNALKPFPENVLDLATPNQHELAAMHAAAKKHEYFESEAWWKAIDALGIPSSGARDRFVSITNHKLTDEGIPIQAIQLLPFIPTILTKLGAEGVLMTELLKPNDPRLTDSKSAPYILSRCANGSTEIGGVYMRLFPAIEVVEDVVSVNGVGDTFLGVLVAGLARDLKLDERLINIAQKGAVMTLRSKESVSPQLGELRAELDLLAQS